MYSSTSETERKMSNFSYWMEEVADMPEQREDGVWLDLETGLHYSPDLNYRSNATATRWAPSKDIKAHRKIAKFYGAAALTGSQKQKKWAESIRADVLVAEGLTDTEKTKLLDCAWFMMSASFWIDNRDIKPALFLAETIVADYRAVAALIEKHHETLTLTGPVSDKDAARSEINAAIKACTFTIKHETA